MASTAPAPARPVQGVTRLGDRQEKLQRLSVLIFTIVPFAGLIFAVLMFWGTGLSVVDVAIALTFYIATGLGVTVGFHRMFTHQSFRPTRAVKIALAVAGSMSVQGAIIDWVATHRRHHAYSDKDGDPHSPHLDEGPGIKGVVRGLWHAHVGWLAEPEQTENSRWAPDLLRDRDIVRINKMFGWLTLATFVLPGVLGGVITGSFSGAVTAFLWGSLVRVFLLHHVTWSINSICHFFGRRPFESDDYSTNNWVLSILSFGESWHNNHHAFPTSAVHGIGRGQIDPTGAVIRLLERLRLARDVKLVSAKQLAAKAVEEFHARPSVVPK
ncbi:MAG TPA: acyl-CoA desaturase [Actinomycetota bacterium]|nr:acyl-CoA desaturase [Actinomycetota bacterium]